MNKESFSFLSQILETPSPSGFETQIQAIIKKRVSKYADHVEIDIHGNLSAVVNPKGAVKVMLAGHCDQIGMMVTHIDDNGFIYFNSIGGIDPAVLPGTRLKIITDTGLVDGIIGHKPIHLLTAEERGKKLEIKKLWIDIGAENGAKAKETVRIGDPIVYVPTVTKLGDNFIAAPGCDDRVGVYVIMEALRIYAEKIATLKTKTKNTDKKLKETKGGHGSSNPLDHVALYAVSTVQEEIGLRGAKTSCFDIDPTVGIAVDVTHASDNPAVDAKEIGTVKLGEGPTIGRGPNMNQVLERMLVSTARANKLKFQPLACPNATPTDANVIQVSRSGVATSLISIPNRYMHSQVEVVDLRDLDTAANLIAMTVMQITNKTSFIPQ